MIISIFYSMKLISLLFVLLTANNVFARQNIIHAIYLADRPDFDSNNELSMISEFGFLLTDGNTNISTITAKMNTSQGLTSWSYQIIGDIIYKQIQQKVDGEKGVDHQHRNNSYLDNLITN